MQYAVRIENVNAHATTAYIGASPAAAWDAFRKHSAKEALTGHRAVWLQRFDPALSGIGGWRTVRASAL